MYRRRAYVLSLGLLLALLAYGLLALGGQTSQAGPAPLSTQGMESTLPPLKPEVSMSVHNDTSPPLRDLIARQGPIVPSETALEIPEGFPTDRAVTDNGYTGDGALQSGFGLFSSLIPSPIITFTTIPNSCNCSPPDPSGDVGPNNYIAMFNLHFRIYDKSGNPLSALAANNTLWAGFGGPCQTENAGDPVVLHDQMADRWLLSQFTDSLTAPFYNCVAISQTSDPLGSYHRYAFQAPTFPDYPKYGVWPDAYYLNTRESGGGVLGNYALERAQMLIGGPAQVVRFPVTELAYRTGLLPADLDGAILPPAGAPNYFVGTQDDGFGAPSGDDMSLYKFHVDWVTPANSTFTGPTLLDVAPYDSAFPCSPGSRDCIPQPGTATKIDILSYRQRPTFRLAYRNYGTHESLVTSQSVEAQPGIAGMRWYELRDPNGTPTIFQQGTYSPDALIHRWMGSIAMDGSGNMALGYSVSSSTVFPGSRYTGRLSTDPPGTMPQGEGTIIDGTGSQTGSQRWGDYTQMSVDPTDDCTFWYTNEYVPTTSANGWRGVVGSFKFPGCVPAGGSPTPTTTGTPPTSTPTRTNTTIPATATPTTCVPGPASWVFGPTYTPGVYAIQGDVAPDGNFYLAGGQDGTNIPQNAVARFNPGSNTFTSLAPLPVAVGQAAVGISGTKMYVAGGFLGGTAITSTLQIYDITSNTWSFGPSMPASTEASAGVVLGNKFYVIGGDDFNVGLTSNYAYDVVANSWTTAAPLPAARTNTNGIGHNGLVYLFGGAVGAGFNADDDLLTYNPGTNSWATLAPAGLTDLGNYGNISPYTAGNLIATVGGSTTFVPSNRTRIYNIAGNSWIEGPLMNESRMGHAQGTLNDGRVIVVTGLLGGGVVRTSSELLNSAGSSCPTPSITVVVGTATTTSTRTPTQPAGSPTATPTCTPSAAGWSAGQSLPLPNVRAFGAYFPANGRFYAMGGRSADAAGNAQLNPLEYNPATNTWITKTAVFSDQQTSNLKGGVVTMGGTPVIIAVGGSAGGGTGGTNETRVYNPIADTMVTLTTDPWPPGLTTVPGGSAVVANKLYILGGYVINTSMSDEIWEFDPNAAAGSRWTLKSAVLPAERGYIPAAAIGTNIYMGGGSEWDGTTILDTDFSAMYDTVANTVTTIAPIPRFTGETSAVNMAGKMWVLGGGRDAPNPSSQVDIYDPIANSWSTGTPFVTARRNFPVDTDGAGKIFLAGGYAPTAPDQSMEIYSSGTICPGVTPSPTSTSGPPTSTNTPTTVPTQAATETATSVPGTATPTSCPIQFTDVPEGHTFYTFIRCLACRGIINGYPCGGTGEPCDQDNNPYFRPGNNITRGQLSKIVAISAGYNNPVSGQTFEDVLPGTAFYTYTEQLAADSVMGGYPCGQVDAEPCNPPDNRPYFRPGNTATRGQLTKIVSNAAGFADPEPTTFTFTDVPVGHTFHIFVERLLINRPGVMEGYLCGGVGEPCDDEDRPYFRPNNTLTRGQGSKIVANTFFPGCNPPLSPNPAESYLSR